MGREIRRVRPDWNHPRDERGRYKPLREGYEDNRDEWWNKALMWHNGDISEGAAAFKAEGHSFSNWHGSEPDADDYMPAWTEEEATKLMLYETCSEGTPCGDEKFDTIEEVAGWAAENASTFADFRATSEQWLDMLKHDFVHHDAGNGIVFL